MGLYRRSRGKNKSGTWLFSFRMNGERVYGSTGETDKQKAMEIFTRRYQEYLEGKWQQGPGIALGKMIEKYLEWSRVNHTPRTHQSYLVVAGMVLKHFPDSRRLSAITAREVEEYKCKRKDQVVIKKGRQLTGATVNRDLTFLQGMFTKAQQWGFIQQSPFQNRTIRKFKEERKPERYLSAQERGALFSACSDKLHPIVFFALATGMRRGEIINLEWKNVNLDRRMLTVEHTKSHRTRAIPLSEKVLEMLKRLPKRGSFVFSHEDGRQWGGMGIRSVFDRAVKRAGIQRISFHDLRHNFAIGFLESSQNANAIYDLKKILGHSSLNTTQRYLAYLDHNARQGMESLSERILPKSVGKSVGNDLTQLMGVLKSIENEGFEPVAQW